MSPLVLLALIWTSGFAMAFPLAFAIETTVHLAIGLTTLVVIGRRRYFELEPVRQRREIDQQMWTAMLAIDPLCPGPPSGRLRGWSTAAPNADGETSTIRPATAAGHCAATNLHSR